MAILYLSCFDFIVIAMEPAIKACLFHNIRLFGHFVLNGGGEEMPHLRWAGCEPKHGRCVATAAIHKRGCGTRFMHPERVGGRSPALFFLEFGSRRWDEVRPREVGETIRRTHGPD